MSTSTVARGKVFLLSEYHNITAPKNEKLFSKMKLTESLNYSQVPMLLLYYAVRQR
jgi:hypothetical protein